MATADLRMTFGALFIGCVISVSLSGMASLQAYIYFRHYRTKDSNQLKATVASVWALDILHTVFICQGVWHYLVLNWGNVFELDHLTWTVAFSIAVTGLLTIIIHGFFANRVWRLSKHNMPLTVVICILAVVRLGSALSTTGEMLRLRSFKLFVEDFQWLFTLGLSLSAFIDVIITATLCFYLQESRRGYTSIDGLIHRLLVYTINNGLLTSLASVIAMVCAVALPHTFLFLALHFIIAKCYMNSLLATLNSRLPPTEQKDSSSHAVAVRIDVEGIMDEPRFYRHRLSKSGSSMRGQERAQTNSNSSMTVPELEMGSVRTSVVDDDKAYIQAPTRKLNTYPPSPQATPSPVTPPSSKAFISNIRNPF